MSGSFGPAGPPNAGNSQQFNPVTDQMRRGVSFVESSGSGPGGVPDLTPESGFSHWMRTSSLARVLKFAVPIAVILAAFAMLPFIF